ncbi:MAG: glutamate 5-kinase [Rhodospirillaceae bacterium]|nr:glutamate 5-kinase [Rhodospirillaceae bacterium]
MTARAAAPLPAVRLSGARRLVVKIGSALLVDEATGAVRHPWLAALSQDIAALRTAGTQVLIVTSGAIAVGREHLGLRGRALRIEEKQAAAATGQIRLAHAYQEALAADGLTVAQVLLTLDDTEQRRRHLNARATLDALLRLGVVPMINENDTVATSEIRFGDNDRLAARVAQMTSADTLVLLSDVDGLYTGDPRRDAQAQHIPVVKDLSPEILAMGGDAPVGYSSGGMVTKLAAARIAMEAGCRMAITHGREPHALKALDDGARCTWFLPSFEPRAARKGWIAGALRPVGTLVIDDGAVGALRRGRSLLPAGVVQVMGSFDRGDPVAITDMHGTHIGQGLCAYSAADARAIAGRRSHEIERILGLTGRDEMVHRDDLAVDR